MKMLENLKKALNDKNMIYGTDRTIKALKLGTVKEVFLASNCTKKTEEDVMHYAKLSGAEVKKLEIIDKEIGMICKKHHSVSVLSH